MAEAGGRKALVMALLGALTLSSVYSAYGSSEGQGEVTALEIAGLPRAPAALLQSGQGKLVYEFCTS